MSKMNESEPIRVLHVIGAMNRGGAETLIMELYRNIDRSKVQFDFLVYNYSGKPGAYDREIRDLGGTIYEAKRRLYRGPIAFCKEIRSFFLQHPQYRIVHSHQFATSGYVLREAKKAGIPITIAHSHIAFPHTDFLRGISDAIGKRMLKSNANYCFGCSEDALSELFGKQSDNKEIFVIKNAIYPQKFLYSGELREKWRSSLGANTKTLILGNVARFTFQKNHEFIIQIFCEVAKEKPNSKLVLVGVGSKQEETKQLAENLGVGDKVIFLNARDDVNEIINAFDIFIMPSRYEGLGIVLIEAQANGLPCVISKDVIPNEADVGADLVTRVSLNQSPEEWAEACINAGPRLNPETAQATVKAAGYGIHEVAEWLQRFYILNWSE